MAISATHYRLLCENRHLLPQGGTLLEIGEANWYGDVNPKWAVNDPDSGYCIDVCLDGASNFELAKRFYRMLFDPSKSVAIDMHGTPEALRHDLNEPIDLREQFDLIINHGTAEHIFNIANVFKVAHDHCQTGGVMIHESPCTGWVDHGFYCLQPTLFYDLAQANCYEICGMFLEMIEAKQTIRLERREQAAQMKQAGTLPDNAMLFVIYRKIADLPFRIPTQGYYARSLSAEGVRAWEECR